MNWILLILIISIVPWIVFLIQLNIENQDDYSHEN